MSIRVQDVKLIHESELSKRVAEMFERPYQLQQQGDMLGQDSVVIADVPAEPEFDLDLPSFLEWSTRDVNLEPPGESWHYPWQRELWWHREFYPDLQEVLNELHRLGELPEGKYAIHVWW